VAAIQSKRSSRRTQPARKTSKKRRRLPSLPKPIITRRGKTTIRRYRGRCFHRFEEARGKPLDYVEFFSSGEYHSIAVCFQDKTVMHLLSSPASPLNPNTLTGRPATGVASSDGAHPQPPAQSLIQDGFAFLSLFASQIRGPILRRCCEGWDSIPPILASSPCLRASVVGFSSIRVDQ
jgi:hypothetical protein